METLYIEGVARHDGPESCVGVREGGGEALTGVRAGRAIEPRNTFSGMPTLSSAAEGNTQRSEMRAAPGSRALPGASRREDARGPRGGHPGV